VLITIDPNELVAASATLHSCATEAADIGSQLRGCACCAMPPELQAAVDELVVVTDRALDSIAARIDVQANDLANRGQMAANDSLATAGAVVAAPAVGDVTVTVPTLDLSGLSPSTGTSNISIGGDSLMNLSGLSPSTGTSTISIGGVGDLSGLSPSTGTSTITTGGDSLGNLSELSPSTGTTNMVITNPDWSSGTARGTIALADSAVQMVNRMVNEPGFQSTGIEGSMIVQAVRDRINGVWTTPSRREIEESAGQWEPDWFVRSKYPYVL
jgi:hypothetical protein